MRVTAKFEGRERVMARLRALVPNAEKEMAAAQLEAAQELAKRIVARAPRRTGRYQASIIGDRISSRPAGKALVGGKGQTKDKNATGVFADFRWRWLEFGTVKMAAQPHIFPTYRAYKKAARRKVAGAVNKAVRRAKA